MAVARGRFWRVLAPRWAHDPLSGAGAARRGGRFNEPGVAALYLSRDLMTAVVEYEQDLGTRPGTFCAYEVVVDNIVDLTDPAVRADLQATPADLGCAWQDIAFVQKSRPPSWDLSARLIAAGSPGILVPSTRIAQAVNLVLWKWNDGPAREVVALDPQTDLPRNQNSWTA